jgi:WD repeat-containing protein 35
MIHQFFSIVSQGMWFEEMINNRNKSVVRDMKWSGDGQKICIVYEDGAVIVGSVDGKRLWGKELPLQLALMEWSPDSRSILFCSVQGECHMYDCDGNPMSVVYLLASEGSGSSPLTGIDWYGGAANAEGEIPPTLAIAFENGNVQLMRGARDDESPIVLRTGLRTSHIKWNSFGTVLSVAGTSLVVEDREVNVVHFYSAFGNLLCSLRVPGSTINALTWEGNSLRVALAVDSFIYFANIRHEHQWGFFGDTLVYGLKRQDKAEACITFLNTRTNDSFAKYVNRFVAIRAAGERCILVTKGETHGQYILILCNALGSPVDSKYIEVEPLSLAMTPEYIIVASKSSVYCWHHSSVASSQTRFGRIPTEKKPIDSGQETIFHVDDWSILCDRGGGRGSFASSSTSDPIAAVASSDKILLIGRQSGAVNCYTLPYLDLNAQYVLKHCPRVMALNCSSTKISVIDVNGNFSLYDIAFGSSNILARETSVLDVKLERKGAWEMHWSDDDPERFALMERNRMYIFRGTEPEEPVLSSGYICKFRDLQITAVLLDDIIRSPEKQKNRDILIVFETKSLRDTRKLLQDVSIQDAYQFVEDNGHPRLWRLLAEYALEKLELVIAERAFVRCSDYHGIHFVKRLQMLDDLHIRRAEIAIYFKKFDNAEQLYIQVDREDLALDLRKHLGDWFKVEKLVKLAACDDDTLRVAWNNIGQYFADRQKWTKAVAYFAQAKNLEGLVNCFYILEDFQALEKLITMVPEGNNILLSDMAKKFFSVGLCQPSVEAHMRAGDVKAAIDVCVELNEWDFAMSIAEQHSFLQIDALLGKYAAYLVEKDKHIEAIDLFRKANKHTDVAISYTNIARSAALSRAIALRVKKLYVLAALEVSKSRHTALIAEVPRMSACGSNTTSAAQTLDGLMSLDQATNTNYIMDGSWRGAEAYHFLLLAHRQLYDGQFEYARRTSLVLQHFEDILNPVELYSLIAISSHCSKYYGCCSKALMKLESIPELRSDKLPAYTDLATAIFLRVR